MCVHGKPGWGFKTRLEESGAEMKERGPGEPLKREMRCDEASCAAGGCCEVETREAGILLANGLPAAREYTALEEAFRDSQAWLQALFEGVETGIFIIDAEKHRLIDANSVAAEMVGVPREKILGNSCHKFVCPAEHGRCPVTDLGQTVDNSERILLTAKGERRAIIKTVRPMEVSGRTLLLESFLDITDRKQAQEELILKTALLEAQAETTIDGILVVDRTGRVLQSNRRFAEIFGFAPEDFHSGDSRVLLNQVASRVPNAEVFVERVRYLYAHESETGRDELCLSDGHCIDRYTSPLHDPSGKYYGRVWYFRDISEAKRAEQALRESEQRYRELFENATEIIFTTDLEGNFISLNRAGQRVLGYTETEASQTAIWRIVTPECWETLKRDLVQMLGGESQLSSEIELTAKDGRRVKLEVKPRLVCDGEKPIEVQAIARDITGRDAAEVELRQAQKLESVGRLAAGIAHEINTPIQYIGDNARFLQESFDSLKKMFGKFEELHNAVVSGAVNDDLLRDLQRAEKESDCEFALEEIPHAIAQTMEGVDRVATIVHAMKEFAHPQRKEMVLSDLNRALMNTLTVARNELKYVAEVETELGALPMVVCNVGELNQVFLNLLVNSAHAVADVIKSGEKGRITVRTEAEGDKVHVSIADTGAGIPESIRNKIYDPFFTTKEVGRGTGQGLAIARSVVVERHKGTLTFESAVGKGTVFHIRLPVSPT